VLGPYEYAVWLICSLLEVAVLVCAFKKDALRRYLFLNVNTGASLVISIARYNILSHYGLPLRNTSISTSYSDALLTITLYFALVSLYSLRLRGTQGRALCQARDRGPSFRYRFVFLCRRPAIQCQLVTHFVVEAIPEPLFRRTCSDLCLVGRRFEDA